jgi:hypothetical protein
MHSALSLIFSSTETKKRRSRPGVQVGIGRRDGGAEGGVRSVSKLAEWDIILVHSDKLVCILFTSGENNEVLYKCLSDLVHCMFWGDSVRESRQEEFCAIQTLSYHSHSAN